jgi:uncharacterized protein (TIGR00369 family)
MKPSDIDVLGPVAQSFGLKLNAWDTGRRELVLDMRVDDIWCNGAGQVQGGAVCAMLDLCCTSVALAASEFKYWMPTLELKASFLAPALPGHLVGVGTVVRSGNRVYFLEARLLDASGRLLATATATALPMPRTVVVP